MTKKELIARLKNLRRSDREIAAMPKGSVRSLLQFLIGEELERLLKVQVESAESPSEELVPRHSAFCALDAKAPSNANDLRAEGFIKAGPLFFL